MLGDRVGLELFLEHDVYVIIFNLGVASWQVLIQSSPVIRFHVL
jgi:hypothetical protein